MRLRARRGFTMLEAVVALAIIGMVCVGVLGAYSAAARANMIAAERLPLASLAEERIAAVDLAPGSLEHLPDSIARGVFQPPFERISWATTTRRVQQTDGLYDITVAVRNGDDQYVVHTRRNRIVR